MKRKDAKETCKNPVNLPFPQNSSTGSHRNVYLYVFAVADDIYIFVFSAPHNEHEQWEIPAGEKPQILCDC